MQRDCALRIDGRRRLTFSVEYKTGNQSLFECADSITKKELSRESRFNLSSDGNRVRVWRPRGERLNPAFALQRHTVSTAGVMV
ncbi:hypothetical protein TNCV_1897651 [Trichonephila clavipes]|uniref:Uncharacterized protein n=1 Tax=Trichonephila clavipes TaxID=2585209 RepID=A0A8X6WG01_TRICX|nr:hypothetical protein TNCV_1897651 [Trichonephila clavipes]